MTLCASPHKNGQPVRVFEDEPAVPTYPFEDWFDLGDERPRFVGLRRDEAESQARDEGLATRVLDISVKRQVGWQADRRPNRLNLVVEDGRVIRAAVF